MLSCSSCITMYGDEMDNRKIGNTWISLNRFRVLLSVINSIQRRLLFISRHSAMWVAIGGTYYFLEDIETCSIQSFTQVLMASASSFYYNFNTHDMYKAATVFERARLIVLPKIDLRSKSSLSYREAQELAYWHKSFQCGRDIGIYEWHFQRMPRLSTILFADTYLQKVINLLIAS